MKTFKTATELGRAVFLQTTDVLRDKIILIDVILDNLLQRYWDPAAG
jgi:hypothetical protein